MTCEFLAPQWTDFRQAKTVFASLCRGQIIWIWDTVTGESWVACSGK